MTWTNQLYYGDNLRVLREEVKDETVDLVYLDPPFNSAANYNVLFREATGEQSAAQIMAFEDTWHWTHESESAYQELVTDAPERLARLTEAMRQMLGTSDMMAYLVMMAPRAQDKKKGKDTGIDGYIRYLEREGEPARTIIVQVKSGKVPPATYATSSAFSTARRLSSESSSHFNRQPAT